MTEPMTAPAHAAAEDDQLVDLDRVAVPALPAPTEVPAATGSPLSGLRQRRAEARKRAHLDVVVPGYEPAVFVRFRALTPEELERIRARHAKAKATEQALRVNSAVLATSCVGVFELDPETGEEVSVDPEDRYGSWPRFDTRLASILGVEADNADATVRALYLEPMHILSVGDEVATWSTGRDQELRRTESGD